MNLKLGLIMFICLVPILIMIYFVVYPKKWKTKLQIFGVKNRDDFKSGETESVVDAIVQKYRNQAMWILIISVVISILLILIPDMTIMMITYTIFILFDVVAIYVPYVRGNTELKSLKRELGITAKGVRAADLRSINSAHALNMPMLLVPNVIAGLGTIVAFLYDFGVINIKDNRTQGSYAASILGITFLSMAVLFVFLAKMTDNMRNEVISEDSEVNTNFNRAKKKIWNDLWIQMSWLNTICLVLGILTVMVKASEAMLLTGSILYMVAICVIFGILASKTATLNGCYKVECPFDDDDDNWIYGIFYCNPKDGRINITRRDGLGATINMGHPLGKVVAGLVVLTLLGTVASLFWVGAVDNSKMEVRLENGNVICHLLRDEYVISEKDIQEVSFGENIEDLNPIRVAGFATDKVLKGNFSVDNDKKARFFMNPNVNQYIRIKTEKMTYFINGNTEEETNELFNSINN